MGPGSGFLASVKPPMPANIGHRRLRPDTDHVTPDNGGRIPAASKERKTCDMGSHILSGAARQFELSADCLYSLIDNFDRLDCPLIALLAAVRTELSSRGCIPAFWERN